MRTWIRHYTLVFVVGSLLCGGKAVCFFLAQTQGHVAYGYGLPFQREGAGSDYHRAGSTGVFDGPVYEGSRLEEYA